MHTLIQDLRHGARLLRKSPSFTIAALLMLAVGIGASTAIFSVVNAVLLRPLPFPDPDRLVFITREGDVSILDGIDWRAQSKTHEAIALFLRTWAFDLSGDGEPERLSGSVVEPEYFRVLGTRPLLGRVLTDEDNRPGSAQVAVLSHAFWTRRFAADAGVVGRNVVLSDVPTTIVGVMPAEFDFLDDDVDLWISVGAATPQFLPERGTNNFDAIGRLRPGVSVDQARAEMVAISQRLEKAYPDSNRRKIVEPLALLEFMVGDVRRSLWVLLAAVGLVMLIGSVNLAGLLLARSQARSGEFALRMAVGASRGRVLRQLLAEGLLLGLLGGAAGLLAAAWAKEALVAAAPESLLRLQDVPLDTTVLLFGLASSVLSGLLLSLVPAFQVMRGDAGTFLKGAGKTTAGASRHRALGAAGGRRAVLRVHPAGGRRAAGADLPAPAGRAPGVRPRGPHHGRRGAARVALRHPRAPDAGVRRHRGRRERDPGRGLGCVRDHAAAVPARRDRLAAPVRASRPTRCRSRRRAPACASSTATTSGPSACRCAKGAAFDERDGPGGLPVAIVNERFAREFWPGRSPIGTAHLLQVDQRSRTG